MRKNNMKASELFVRCLEDEGVQYIFGIPGEENLAILEAIRKSKIKFIVTKHEQAAAFMAATVGRLTGVPGVALSTLGPGATNLLTGIAYANLGGMPMLAITGQKPIRKVKQGKFQLIDVVRLMEPVTKFSETIESGERVQTMVRQAFKIAEYERPGAVHLELPEDIMEEKVFDKPIILEKIRRPVGDEKAILKAVEVIESAKSPIVLISAGANRKLIRKQLKAFLEKTGVPFATTQMGKGVEDESSELYIGTTALSKGDYVHKALEKADVVIVIGHDVSEKPPIILTPERHKVIHINFYPSEINEVYIPTLEVIGDISNSLWQITNKITVQKKWDLKYFFKIKKELQKNIEKYSGSMKFPLLPERIVADLRKAIPKDGILSLDNGMYKIWVARNYPAYEQNSVLLDNALATMGAGIPAGIAAKILFPDKKVLIVTGDGGFMMSSAEIETARRLGLDLTILVLSDLAFGMIRWKQEEMHLPDFAMDFKNPDFKLLAKSFGATGTDIKKAKDLLPTIKKCLNTKGVHVINCPIDYSMTTEALGKGLQKELSKI